jgi:hypothetical protein
MSCITQPTKCWSDWTYNELQAYNIVIRNQSATAFFGQGLPITLVGIDTEFLTSNVTSEVDNHGTERLLMYLGFATEVNGSMSPIEKSFCLAFTPFLYRSKGRNQ